MLREEENFKLSIKTWSKDSNGLFDYESTSIKKEVMILKGNCKLIRYKNQVKIRNDDYVPDIEENELSKFNLIENKIILYNPINLSMSPTEANINELQNRIWYVLRRDSNEEFCLNSNIISSDMFQIGINDIIKLGRVNFTVTALKIDDILQTIDNLNNKPVFELITEYKYFLFTKFFFLIYIFLELIYCINYL